MRQPDQNRHWPTEQALRLLHGPDLCEMCGGRGWIAVPDALYDGEYYDARCPECAATKQALRKQG